MKFEAFRTDRRTTEERRDSAAIYDQYGLSLPELRIVVAVMAHERRFGIGARRKDIEELGIDPDPAMTAIRARWLVDRHGILIAAPKAWKIFKFRKDETCSAPEEVTAAE